MSRYAEVVFPLPLARTFTYLLNIEEERRARVGARVLAPFGTRLLTGFIVHLRSAPPISAGEIREIKALLDEEPAFSPRFLAFTRLLGRKYASSWGEFLAASVPPSFLPRARSRFRMTSEGLSAGSEGRVSEEEKRLAGILGSTAYSARFLKKKLGAGASALLSRMRAKGFVEEVEPGTAKRGRRPRFSSPSAREKQLALDFPPPPGLDGIFSEILRPERSKRSGPFYLFGGAKRREAVYEALLRAVWKASGRVVFLVPEISQAVALARKCEDFQAGSAAVLHSRLTERQREEQWMLIRTGRARVVAGPRSALFVPLAGLQLVVVEEEEDDSFYQAESPSYDARQAAPLLGRVMGASVVYGSGHPSVESFYAAETAGRVVRLEGEPPPAAVRLVDVRKERGYLSRGLIEAVRTHVRRGGRMIVFLNRRGFAASVICARCGRVPRCYRCDIPLFFLKKKNSLVCRYCSTTRPAPRDCPDCGGPLRLGRNPGVEAVREEIQRMFPRLRIAAFDTDTVRNEEAQARVLDRFDRGRIDLLVGTQLLASRRGAPPASLVAVLNPESILSIPDYGSGQRTYHSLCRMMSFARDPGSEVIIQTVVPDHHALTAAARGDFDLFYKTEVEFRKMMSYPPFSHMVEVLFEGSDIRRLARQARDFSDRVRRAAGGVEIQGPSRALGLRRKGRERLAVMLRAVRRDELVEILDSTLRPARAVRSVHLRP